MRVRELGRERVGDRYHVGLRERDENEDVEEEEDEGKDKRAPNSSDLTARTRPQTTGNKDHVMTE